MGRIKEHKDWRGEQKMSGREKGHWYPWCVEQGVVGVGEGSRESTRDKRRYVQQGTLVWLSVQCSELSCCLCAWEEPVRYEQHHDNKLQGCPGVLCGGGGDYLGVHLGSE